MSHPNIIPFDSRNTSDITVRHYSAYDALSKSFDDQAIQLEQVRLKLEMIHTIIDRLLALQPNVKATGLLLEAQAICGDSSWVNLTGKAKR